jgi:NADH-quinone oxidoreductase subunit L
MFGFITAFYCSTRAKTTIESYSLINFSEFWYFYIIDFSGNDHIPVKFTFFERLNIVIKHVLNQKFYFDVIYSYFCIKILFLASYLYINVDKGFLEIIGPTGVSNFFFYLHKVINDLHDGFLFNYIQYTFFGTLCLLNLLLLF